MNQTTDLQNQTNQNELNAATPASGQDCSHSNNSCCHPTVEVRPRAEIVEYSDHFLMALEVPGVAKENLDVTLEKGTLTIEGVSEFRFPDGYEAISGHPVRRKYERSFRISDEIDREGIEVEMSNGVVTFKLPKCQSAQKTKLTVN